MTIDRQGKGWFSVPGIRARGDRTLEEQLIGLERALSYVAADKCSVLDLGCAEGLISLAFARRGASRVVGIELLEGHVEVARKVCRKFPQIELIHANLATMARKNQTPERFGVVLALGVAHKLHDPSVALRFAARSSASMLVFRGPSWYDRRKPLKSKHTDTTCDVSRLLEGEGFAEDGTSNGPRGEQVQYWRRRG